MQSPLLHPWLAEARIAFPRQLALLQLRAAVTTSIAFATLVAIVLVSTKVSVFCGWLVRAPTLWPVLSVLATGLLSHAWVRSRSLLMIEQCRSGWLAAVPVDSRSVLATSLVLATLSTLVAMLASVVVLGIAAFVAKQTADVAMSFATITIGLCLGAASGWLVAVRHVRKNTSARQRREGIRQPVFALAWLNDSDLPHLLDWQRRETVLRLRRGGNAWWLGAALFALPSGVSNHDAFGFMLLAFSLSWFGVAMRACSDSSRQAMALCAATPLARKTLTKAGMRYPMIVAVCAMTLGLIANELAGFGWAGRSTLIAIVAMPATRMLWILMQSGPSPHGRRET
jgi:hypothetical protein